MTIEWLAGNRLKGTTAERPAFGLQSPSVGGWVELGRTTLGSAGDNIDITSLPDKRYYMYLLHRDTSGSTSARMTFNDDSGSNYSTRYASDGTEYTAINQAYVSQHTSASQDSFTCGYIANKSSNEKLIHSWVVGNASPPSRYEQFWKWTNTSSAINRMDIFNHLGGDFASGSELVVLGWDPSDTHTTNFWEELASVELSSAGDEISSGTITAKKYLWLQWHTKRTGAQIENRINFNNDTGSNYTRRSSVNGASDATAINQSRIEAWSSKTSSSYFYNMFIINNSSNEKLCIGHNSEVTSTGAGNAPARVEFVARWANTSSQITEIDIINNETGSFDTGSTLKIWGAD